MRILLALCALMALASPGVADEAGDSGFPFAAGRTLSRTEAEQLEPWLPAAFWAHRQHFFYDGMKLQVGPAFRDYSPPPVYREATDAHRGTASVGADDELLGYQAGLPFPDVNCEGDPQAGAKLIWNFTWRWQGFGIDGRARYSYWEKGEKRSLYYQGRTFAWFLKHRPEPQFSARGGDVFRKEKRAVVVGLVGEEPLQARGVRTLTYRYEASLGARATAQPEDTWIFVPDLRRTRKISESRRSTAFAGTDFTFDDLFSFSGVPPQYQWSCLGEAVLLAPTNTARLAYPYREDADFGPSGLSYGSDRWELRRAVGVRMVPKDPEHPYSRKDVWLDRQTFAPLYSFAYDRSGVLWKIIHHAHRWSEDDLEGIPAREWYPGWEGVPEPRDLKMVSEALLNVQTGNGNRLDFWDAHGSPPPLRELRQRLDVRSLARGR